MYLPENDEFGNVNQFSLGLQLWGGMAPSFGSSANPGGAFDSVTGKKSNGAHTSGVHCPPAGCSGPCTSMTVGKDYGSAIKIGRARVYGVTDLPFGLGTNGGSYTLRLYGANALDNGTMVSPTLCGERTVGGAAQNAAGTAGVWTVFNMNAAGTAFRYWAIEVSHPGACFFTLAQVRFYTPNYPLGAPTNAHQGEGPWRWVWTVPANWTAARIHVLTAGGGGGGGGGNSGLEVGQFGGGGCGGWYGIRHEKVTPGEQFEVFIPDGGHRGLPGLSGNASGETIVQRLNATAALMRGLASPGGHVFSGGAGGGLKGINERIWFPLPPGPGGDAQGWGGGNMRFGGGSESSSQRLDDGGSLAGEVGVPQGCGGAGAGDRGEGGDGSTGYVRFDRA